MRFAQLLHLIGDEPLFDSGLLLVGDVDRADIRRQLSRWASARKLIQLRRGLYALAPPYQKRRPHSFFTANRLHTPSMVSLQSALAYYGLIPEGVPTVTSVTTRRPCSFDTPLGGFLYRHIKPSLLWGSRPIEVADRQTAWIASPEKALWDLIYLEPGADSLSYLEGLRLQNLDQLDMAKLVSLAGTSPRLKRAVNLVTHLAEGDTYEEVL